MRRNTRNADAFWKAAFTSEISVFSYLVNVARFARLNLNTAYPIPDFIRVTEEERARLMSNRNIGLKRS